MKRLAVLNVVGLTSGLIERYGSFLKHWAPEKKRSSFPPAFPAVTTTAQSTYLTGKAPAQHGIVGNGWYDREAAEPKFWKQSNHLVKGQKVWEELKAQNPDFTCAKLFWWYNMYSSADYTITPRPLYPADGRKIFDIYTQPMGMREEIKTDLGDFPFMSFWGPKAGLASSSWIAQSAKWIEEKKSPHLSLVYLPHLDYVLQQEGPGGESVAAEFAQIERVITELIRFYEQSGVEVMLVSEYGISEVNRAVHLNRLFREKGWLTLKVDLGREYLDCGASKVFAVADHQVAHVYLQDPQLREPVREFLQGVDGVERVYDQEELFAHGAAQSRAGDLIVEAQADAWFTYYFWMEDRLAPDYARCIDIHRKPGYDPAELFFDPKIRFLPGKIGSFLAKKTLGMRALLEVIPLDATLVKGSHGRHRVPEAEQPLFIGDNTIREASEVYREITAFFQKSSTGD